VRTRLARAGVASGVGGRLDQDRPHYRQGAGLQEQAEILPAGVRPEAKFRVWLVIDGDTLYVDHNGNGDLTEPGEAVTRPPGGGFQAGTITEPDGIQHTQLQLQAIQTGSFVVAMRIEGKRLQCVQVDGPCPRASPPGSRLFADHPRAAPIVHFNGPLTMKLVYHEGVWPMPNRGERVVEVVAWLGTPGLGEG